MRGMYSGSSAGVQFLILFMLGVGGALFFSALGAVLASVFFDVALLDIFTDPLALRGGSVAVLKWLQLFSSIGTFVVPSVVGAYLFSQRPLSYLGFRGFANPLPVLALVLVVALCGNAVSDLLYRFSTAIPWPEGLHFLKEALQRAEETMADQIQLFLKMEGFTDFLSVFFIMAVLPAVGEELLFRGVLQKVVLKGFGNVHVAVWITAFLFSLLHQQVYAFLSILALGALLGYLRQWSGSLWLPILLHLANNGMIIIAVYFFDIPYNNKEVLESGLEWHYTVPMLVGFVAGLAVLYRILHKPLPNYASRRQA